MSGNTNPNFTNIGSPDNYQADFNSLSQRAIDYLGTIGIGGGINVRQFGAIGDGITDDTDAIQAAFDAFAIADESSLNFEPDKNYLITSTITVDLDGRERFINGNNCTLTLDFAGFGIPAISFGASEKYTVSYFNVISIGNLIYAFDAQPSGGDFIRFYRNIFTDCFTGLRVGLGGPNTPSFLIENRCYSCANGIYCFGDYNVIEGNFCTGCTTAGIIIGAAGVGGNSRVINNTCSSNVIGILCEAVSRGVRIACNTVNHNSTCGILLRNMLAYAEVTDNEILANYGGSNVGVAPLDHQFGMLVDTCVGVEIKGNTLGVNKFSLGLNGHAEGNISDNHFIGLSSLDLTTDHLKELGGTNANYNIDGNMIRDYLISGHTNLATNCPNATIVTTNKILHQTS